MEAELDDIETHKFKRNDVLNEFYVPFELALKEAEGKLAGGADKCPECGKPLVERFSRFGKFFGCSGHPDCKYIKRGGTTAPARAAQARPTFPAPTAASRWCSAWAGAARFWVAAAIPNARRR